MSTNPWIAIVGFGRQGKRETARAVADALRARGLTVAGAVAEPSVDVERGYDLVDLVTGSRTALARLVTGESDICDLEFADGIFAATRDQLMASEAQVKLIEVGPYEARSKGGHWPTILALLSGAPTVVVLCIRPDALAPLALGIADPAAWLELPATAEGDGSVAALVDEIAEVVTRTCPRPA